VWAAPSAWAELMAARADLADLPWLAGWAERGWPLMARRPSGAEPPGRVALGLPLPPSAGKRRIAVDLAPDAFGGARAPPLLAMAKDSAPAAWRATVMRLIALQPQTRVFGALAWQGLTGLDYLSATSDLDLLWPLPSDDAEAILAGIAVLDAQAPMRLDGELVRSDGAAVNWRELAFGSEQVLVKRLDGLALASRREFLDGAA
jgi:phosphoribosyl-dephospho-CoA transferase